MKKSNGDIPAKAFATFQLSLLVFSIFSFSFIISSVDLVSAESTSALPTLSKTPFWEVGKNKMGSVLVDGEPKGIQSAINPKKYIPTGSKASSEIPQNAEVVGQTGIGSATHALLEGVSWAAYAYMAGQMLGSMLGFNEDNTDALSTSLAAGFGVGRALHIYSQGGGAGSSTFGANGWLGGNAGMVGFAVTVVVFALMYKDVETKVVTFSCLPWQAPNGGDDCEICNDADLPCSEYRCKSLGQSCEIVNAGSVEESCVYVNPRDVSPPVISPDYSKLSAGHAYKNVKNSPPGPGFDIENLASGDGCLKAFSPLEFGLTTDEPAQCKIDINSTAKFDDMIAYVGGSNLYLYNHTEKFSLPGAKELSGSGIKLVNGKDMSFFVRCKDKNGNENSAEYAVNFCVDPSPDTTAPKIEATSVLNGGCVAENTDNS